MHATKHVLVGLHTPAIPVTIQAAKGLCPRSPERCVVPTKLIDFPAASRAVPREDKIVVDVRAACAKESFSN